MLRLTSEGNKKGSDVSPSPCSLGGAEEDRTPDLRIANATLSQLSYRPKSQRLYTVFRVVLAAIQAF
jgi:hypothetical protein